MQLRRTISKKLGNTFFTSLLFLFILATTLRVCSNKTLQECKLTNVFIQETQSYYLLENLMALARDYAYQLTQNPMMPNLFLSVFAYRDKDKSSGNTGTIIDFNGSLSKQQIVPDDFPLQISSWDIKGGPIFWQEKQKKKIYGSEKTDTEDKRHFAEVFMLGELAIDSKLVPGWKARIVQTMEIERNPLSDFQLYAEGDTLINNNIWSDNKAFWYKYFYGPVQINGNARFPFYSGTDTSAVCHFKNKVNIAGHALRIKESDSYGANSIKIPKKYCFYDTSEFYDKFTNPYTTGKANFSVNIYSVKSASSNNINFSSSNFSNTTLDSNFSNYEQYVFHTFNGNFMTRSRVYRPCGFDPISDWGFWYPEEGGGVSADARVLDMCFGLHNLCKSSAVGAHMLYGNSGNTDPNTRPAQAASNLRGLDKYQMTEKARLVESQKIINAPGLEVRLLLKDSEGANKESLRVPINYPYVTYDRNHFPAENDSKYLNWYFKLKFQENSVLDELAFNKNCIIQDTYYELNRDPSPIHQFDIASRGSKGHPQAIQNNKLVIQSVETTNLTIDDALRSIFRMKKGFDQVAYNDPSSPPHKLIENKDPNGLFYWTLDSVQTRLHTSGHQGYQFIYDRNRAKWIQLMDIDVKALKDAVANGVGVFAEWNGALNRTIKINIYWQSSEYNANINYKDYTHAEDIRLNYISRREQFLNLYGNGSYVYPSNYPPVIDVGVRLINAEELPTDGMTLICPYPLYIQGDFNTTNLKSKVCLVTDSLTILSKDWQDWRSGMDFFNSYLYSADGKSKDPYITAPTIFAHIITGRTHPNYWLKDNGLFPDFGIHDAFRTLEDFHTPINFRGGSLLLPYYCQRQWEPPINFANATRVFSYAPLHVGTGDWLMMGVPHGMPTYLRINRGRKTQAIGSYVYNTLLNNVRGTTISPEDYTFTTYHDSLPNFLKYPTDPSND